MACESIPATIFIQKPVDAIRHFRVVFDAPVENTPTGVREGADVRFETVNARTLQLRVMVLNKPAGRPF